MRKHFFLTIISIAFWGLHTLQARPSNQFATIGHGLRALRTADKTAPNSGVACSATAGIQIASFANSASIFWVAVDGVSSFDVEVESEQNTPDFKVEQRVSGTSFEVNGLTAGGLYKVKVKSRCGDKPEAIEFFTAGSGDGNNGSPTGQPTGNCAATSRVTVNAAGTAATILWEAVEGVSTFEVEVENEQTTPAFHVEQRVSGTSFEVSGLTAGGLYNVKVKSRCGDKPEAIEFFTAGSGDGNNGSPTGQPTGNCAATSRVTVNAAGTAATILWEAVEGVSTFEVEVENEQTTPAFHVEQPVSGTSFEVSGLTAGGLYKVKVKSRCGDKPETVVVFNSESGVTNSTNNGAGSCTAVEHIRIQPLSGSSVLIFWNSENGSSNYELEVEREESDVEQKLNILTTDTSWQVEDLIPGGLYKVQVNSKCSMGGEVKSVEVFFIAGMDTIVTSQVAPDNCLPVSGLHVIPGDPQVQINWDPVPGAAYYEVEIEAEQTSIPWKIKEFSLGNSLSVNGLAAGTIYQVKVIVICSGGTKSLSSGIQFTNPDGIGNVPFTLELERHAREINILRLTPNPASQKVNLQVNSTNFQDARITVSDFTGRVYYHRTGQVPPGPSEWTIPLEQMASGIYQVTLQVGNRISVGKLSVVQ